MSIITLTSDWGLRDHYVGSVKGAILRLLPEVTIVDISHLVPAFDLKQASFIIGNAYHYFPKGTIHIVAVDSVEASDRQHVAIKADGHYFIGADNGIFTLFLEKQPDVIVGLKIMQDSGYFTFPTRDRFVKAACHLASGGEIEELGDITTSHTEKFLFQPVANDSMIQGKAIYVDRYGNVFTNISKELFLKTGNKRNFNLIVKRSSNSIKQIREAYDDVHEGDMLALFASNGYLQIAINRGSANTLLGIKIDDTVMITFED
jgi:S-adenosyl-L-methionine hydrolase (adenosine-forming)